MTFPKKTAAAVVTGAALAVAVLNSPTPQVVPLAATTAPPTTSVSIAFDRYTQPVTGIMVLEGQQSGHYGAPKFLVTTNLAAITNPVVTITNVPSDRPLFVAIAAYLTNAQPTNTLVTNPVTHVVVTNSSYVIASPLSDEVLFVPSNCQPFLMVTNGAAAVIGYGAAANAVTIYAGVTPLTVTNAVASFMGTNGPFRYLDGAATAPAKFFKVVRQ